MNDILGTGVSDLNKQENAVDKMANSGGSVFDFSGLRDRVKKLFDGKTVRINGAKASPERIGEKSFKYSNPVLEKYYAGLNKEENKLEKGKAVDMTAPMSERFFFKKEGPGERTYAAKGHGKETAGYEGLFTHRQMEKAGEKMGGPDVGVADIASTAIHRVRYNPKTKNLYVTFVGGDKEYLFPNVPEDAVKKFLNASSKGRHYGLRIKPYAVSKEQAMAIKARDKNN